METEQVKDKDNVQSYSDYIKEKQGKEKEDSITQSIDAVGTLGATLGIGGMIANKPKFGIPTAAGAAGTMLGYHGTKILGGSPALRLIIAALTGGTAAGAALWQLRDKEQQA